MNSMGPPPLKSTERPPLITPSASPPPSRFTYRNPDSDGPSPTKRQRLFSTPRLTYPESSTSSSVSRPQSPVDVQKEREASKLRLLDVWAGIAERYKVPVEDDDLVNIRTGKITKDNGFLRRQETLHFGMIAAPTSGSDDEGSEEDEEDEYDVDELDAFADENLNLGDDEDIGPQIDLKPPANANPFASIMKVAEEEDLRQFMKAEQERKALCGSDVEDYEEDEYSSEEEYTSSLKPDGGTESDLEASAEPDFDEENGLEQEMEAVGEHGQEGPEEQVEEEQTEVNLAGTVDKPIPLYLDSEDELDNWNEDESSIVYPVVKSEPPEDHISANEEDEVTRHPDIFTEVAVVVKPSDNYTKPTKANSRPKSIKNSHQLYTPPQSQSSSRSSAAPMIEVIDLSSSTESSPPPFAFVSQKSLKGQSKPNNSKIPVVFQRKPFQKTKPHPTAPKESTTATPKLSAKTSKTTSRPKPYVLLPPRNASSSGKARSDLPSPKAVIQNDRLLSEDDSSEPQNSSPSKVLKGKGKAKAMEIETTGAQPRKSDKTRHVSSGPSSDVRRVSTRSQNATRPIDEGESVSTETSSRSKTRSGVQGHKTSSSSKTSSKDAKLRTKKSDVASDDESASTHRKRKRTSLDSTPSSPMHDFDSEKRRSNSHKIDHSSTHASTSRITLDEDRKGRKGTSSRRRETSSSSDPDTGLEEDPSASESDGQFRRNRQQPQVRQSLPPAHHSYHHMPYPPSHYPPQDYPPIPDPRAQLIITHAMHQLSALVGGSWGPPPHYGDGAVPYTPTHRRHDARASAGPFLTPTHHPHPYPYAYDPNYSNATLPPDSSEVESSPRKQSSSRRKSIVKRSQSRGRRVSFRVDEEERGREVEGRCSPTPKEKGHQNGSRGSNSKKSKSKGRENVQERHEESSDGAELDYDSDGASRGYVRGRTPGPSSDRGRSRTRKQTPSK